MFLAATLNICSVTPSFYPDPVGAGGFIAKFGGWQREYNISPGQEKRKKSRKISSDFTGVRNSENTQAQESIKVRRLNRTSVSNRLHRARFFLLEMFEKPCIVSIGGGAK